MFAAAEVAKLTKEEYKAYIDDLNSYRDYYNTLDYAREKGLEEGEVIGLEKGEAIGLEKGKAIGLEKGKAERSQLKGALLSAQERIAELERMIKIKP
jgi:mRNA degradation ribonuclease J1/J2